MFNDDLLSKINWLKIIKPLRSSQWIFFLSIFNKV